MLKYLESHQIMLLYLEYHTIMLKSSASSNYGKKHSSSKVSGVFGVKAKNGAGDTFLTSIVASRRRRLLNCS